MSLDTQPILRKPCPPHLCDCGYYNLVSDQSETCVDPDIQRYPGFGITKMQERIITEKIERITTLDQFYVIREVLRKEYRITFLVEPKGRMKIGTDGGLCSIKIDTIDGLCRLTRDKVCKSLQKVFSENQGLLIALLDRDSLFSNASDERE